MIKSLNSIFPFLRTEFLNNTILDYLIGLIALIVFLIIFKIFQSIVLHKLKNLAEKTKTDIDDTLIKIVKSLKPGFYVFLSFWLALFFLNINEIGQKIIDAILLFWITYQVIIGMQIFIDYVIEKKFIKNKDKSTKTAASYLSMLSKGALWVIGIILVLGNLGVDVTSLIAGLGIGGIALALALQNILGDLFASLAIFFDKPFEIGDYIVAEPHSGTVEKIGIRSTRIRSLDGEEIVISNQELTSARLQNYKTIKKRRALVTVGVTYDTVQSKLRLIPKLLKEAVETTNMTEFERANFTLFGDSALNFELVFYVKSTEYLKFVKTQEKILLKIKQTFEKEKIEMAFPTQTVYIQKES